MTERSGHAEQHLPSLGCSRDDLETPALCIDLDLMEKNIRRVVAACDAAGVSWRPHVKGHRSGAIGVREVAAGAIGLTCAKLGEAEALANAGVGDILLPYPLNPVNASRVAALHDGVAIDSARRIVVSGKPDEVLLNPTHERLHAFLSRFDEARRRAPT